MTIPNAADDALYDGIKGPSLRQATGNSQGKPTDNKWNQWIEPDEALAKRQGWLTIWWNKRAKPMADNSQSKPREKQRLNI